MSKFYNKYRPQSFNEVIGQKNVCTSLKNIIKEKFFEKVFIFAGAHGTGKTTIARIFSKAINCMQPNDGDACRQCKSCLEFENNFEKIQDYIEIDAASNNSVEDAVNLLKDTKYSPTFWKYKIYLIDEVQMLSKEAFAKYLKTFEEKHENIVFILATTELKRIPKTIISRALVYPFKTVLEKDIVLNLKNISYLEKIEIDEKCAHTIAENVNGSFRDAIVLLEQLSIFCEKKINLNKINEFLEIPEKEEIESFVDNLLNHNKKNLLILLSAWKDKNFNIDKIMTQIYTKIRKMTIKILLSNNCNYKNHIQILKLIYEICNEIKLGYQNYDFIETKILLSEYLENNLNLNDLKNENLKENEESWHTQEKEKVFNLIKGHDKKLISHLENILKKEKILFEKIIACNNENKLLLETNEKNKSYKKINVDQKTLYFLHTNDVINLKKEYELFFNEKLNNNNAKINSDIKKNLDKNKKIKTLLEEKFIIIK